jgi:exopolysaccharide production protein ExoZ
LKLGAIQALRAIGAALVVFQHVSVYVLMSRGIDFQPYLRFDFGRAGVLLFFVISGFVMVGCMREGRSFIVHRALRIYPGFWLAAAVSFLLLGTPYGPKALLLLPHELANSPYTVPYWTLIYEVVFYAVTYVLILTGLQRKGLTVVLLAWLASLVAVSRYQQVPLLVPAQWIWFSTLNAYYILGMLAALYREDLDRVPSPVLGLFAIVAWAVGEGLKSDVMASQAVLACAYVSLLLLALRWSWNAWFAKLGDWSYGLYLVHVPLIGVAIQAMTGTSLRVSAAWLLVFVFAMAAGLAFGWVESRLHRRFKALKAWSPKRAPAA